MNALTKEDTLQEKPFLGNAETALDHHHQPNYPYYYNHSAIHYKFQVSFLCSVSKWKHEEFLGCGNQTFATDAIDKD